MKVYIIFVCIILLLLYCLYILYKAWKNEKQKRKGAEKRIEEQQKQIHVYINYIKTFNKIGVWNSEEEQKIQDNPDAVIADIINANNNRVQDNTKS